MLDSVPVTEADPKVALVVLYASGPLPGLDGMQSEYLSGSFRQRRGERNGAEELAVFAALFFTTYQVFSSHVHHLKA